MKQQFQETVEDLSWVLIKPRLTEKAANLGSENVYTFNVSPDANKIQVKKAIKMYFKVLPTRVNMLVNKERDVVKRGRRGVQSGFKKAMVHLKKGDVINFV